MNQVSWLHPSSKYTIHVAEGDIYEFTVNCKTRGGLTHPRGSYIYVHDRTGNTPHGEIGPCGYNWICRTQFDTTVWATLEQCIERGILKKIDQVACACTKAMSQTETVKFGDLCPPENRGCEIATDEWRYILDADGKQTHQIKRVKGRTVGSIAYDLGQAIEGMNFEWATLGQGYKYQIAGEFTECPDHNGLAVYVTHGGSEGHLVHVDLMIVPEHGDGTSMIHKKLFMVKTFAGPAYATRIAHKLMRVLGVL